VGPRVRGNLMTAIQYVLDSLDIFLVVNTAICTICRQYVYVQIFQGREENIQLSPSRVILITTNLCQHESMLLTVEKGTLGIILIQKFHNFCPLKEADQFLSLCIVVESSKYLREIIWPVVLGSFIRVCKSLICYRSYKGQSSCTRLGTRSHYRCCCVLTAMWSSTSESTKKNHGDGHEVHHIVTWYRKGS